MRGSRAAISSTRRFTCSECGSARAEENTASRTGFTSFANSSLSWPATSSVMRAMVIPRRVYLSASRQQEDSGEQAEHGDGNADGEIVAEGDRGLAAGPLRHDEVRDGAEQGEIA